METHNGDTQVMLKRIVIERLVISVSDLAAATGETVEDIVATLDNEALSDWVHHYAYAKPEIWSDSVNTEERHEVFGWVVQ